MILLRFCAASLFLLVLKPLQWSAWHGLQQYRSLLLARHSLQKRRCT
jgi:hypothetical protein